MRSAFVTGAYGLLGGWLTKALLDQGSRVVVLKRDEVPLSALALEGTEAHCAVVRGDITDAEILNRVLTEYEVDTVFHLAAQTIVGTANRSPLSTFETNVRGTYLLLEACRTYGGIDRVVVAASDKAYGPHEALPYREDFALLPRYPYDASKAAADLIARSYWHTYGLPVAITRFANLYGGGDANHSRLIPSRCPPRSPAAGRSSAPTAAPSATTSTSRTR
jgi:CDP-glucose 4,6-dehydratase